MVRLMEDGAKSQEYDVNRMKFLVGGKGNTHETLMK